MRFTESEAEQSKQQRYQEKLRAEGFRVRSVVCHDDDLEDLQAYGRQLRERRRKALANK